MTELHMRGLGNIYFPYIEEGVELIDLDYNEIDNIGIIPKSCNSLSLSHNKITKIDNLLPGTPISHCKCTPSIKQNNINLKELYLDSNKIEKIEGLPDKLEKLYLGDNLITDIQPGDIPDSVDTLDLSYNIIYTIRNMPPNIITLNLADNSVRKIPKNQLPDCIEYLYLNNNRITVMENIPKKIKVLDLSHNWIRKIENIEKHKYLKELKINENPISKLEGLPISLTDLYITTCLITKIEVHNGMRKIFGMDYNMTEKILNLPDTLIEVETTYVNNDYLYVDDLIYLSNISKFIRNMKTNINYSIICIIEKYLLDDFFIDN